MKKRLLIVLAILLLTTPAHAQYRGLLQGIWASWTTVTNTTTTMTFPFNSRDITINNGNTSTTVCINPKGGTIGYTASTRRDGFGLCMASNATLEASVFLLPPSTSVTLTDHNTNIISFRTFADNATSASPLNVIVTF